MFSGIHYIQRRKKVSKSKCCYLSNDKIPVSVSTELDYILLYEKATMFI